jgi:hypothetical protein
VLKDQLSRSGTGFDKYSILARVHNPEKVTGVVQAAYHELFEISLVLGVSREKHRMGLQKSGSFECPSAKRLPNMERSEQGGHKLHSDLDEEER